MLDGEARLDTVEGALDAAASDEHLIKYDDGDQKAHKLGEEESAGQLRWL